MHRPQGTGSVSKSAALFSSQAAHLQLVIYNAKGLDGAKALTASLLSGKPMSVLQGEEDKDSATIPG